MSIIHKFGSVLWRLYNHDYIPKLPRGYLANEYKEYNVTHEQWRVLRRIGARDPHGVKRALRQYNVDSIDELIQYLEHHKPERRIQERFMLMMGRYFGGARSEPYTKEIRRAFKRLNNKNDSELRQRLNRAKRI